jgi:uncharacterized protein YraI
MGRSRLPQKAMLAVRPAQPAAYDCKQEEHPMTSIRSTLLLAAFLCVIPSAALAQEAYTNRTANVRAGPDQSYPAVAQLPPGVGLQVMGCIEGYSWCDVVFGGNRGWVYAGSISYPYENRRVPILAYGPTIGIPIITFSIGSYWDSYYRGRPWYRNRTYWINRSPPRFRPEARFERRSLPSREFNRGSNEPRRVESRPHVDRPVVRPDRSGSENRSGGRREGRQEGGRERRD